MKENEEKSNQETDYNYLIILLGVATLVLATGTLYMMEVLSMNYGIVLGAAAARASINSTTGVANVSAQTAVSLEILHTSVREAYLIFLIGLCMLGASFVLYINRGSRQSTESQKYVTIHSVMVFFYVAMFVLIFDGYPINVFRAYFLMLYAAIATVVAIDGYLEFKAHVEPMLKSKEMRTDPNTPYSNMVRLREEIFSTLGGDIRIVDKHFNSQALSNLHRLLESSLQSIKSIEILTSRDMLDSGFNENYTDFKNELNNRGIALNLMLMGEADSAAQHERFIFDGTRAYKIPPLNIINRKSEHIVSLGQGEAERRFDALTKNAIKYDNYVVRQARDNNR